jgi:hypothetical protein
LNSWQLPQLLDDENALLLSYSNTKGHAVPGLAKEAAALAKMSSGACNKNSGKITRFQVPNSSILGVSEVCILFLVLDPFGQNALFMRVTLNSKYALADHLCLFEAKK